MNQRAPIVEVLRRFAAAGGRVIYVADVRRRGRGCRRVEVERAGSFRRNEGLDARTRERHCAAIDDAASREADRSDADSQSRRLCARISPHCARGNPRGAFATWASRITRRARLTISSQSCRAKRSTSCSCRYRLRCRTPRTVAAARAIARHRGDREPAVRRRLAVSPHARFRRRPIRSTSSRTCARAKGGC